MTDLCLTDMAVATGVHPKDADACGIATTAVLLGISRTYLYELIKAGTGPRVTRIGGRVIITKEDRIAWLRTNAA